MCLRVERWAKGKEQEWYLSLQRERLGGQYWQHMRKHAPDEPIREQDQFGSKKMSTKAMGGLDGGGIRCRFGSFQ